jgi:hypothetical protein
MKFATLVAVVAFALTAEACHAQWPPNPIRNTPFDPGTWRLPSLPPPQGSTFTDPDPAPTVTNRWDCQGSSFRHQGNGWWIEVLANGAPANHFRELNRDQYSVHMWDANRKMFVLLTSTKGLFRRTRNDQWSLWTTSNGTGSTGGFR